jgi:magnesium and cobalt transporter
MPDDTADNSSPSGRSWLERLSHFFTSDPENRTELLALIKSARDDGMLDIDTYGIIEGALEVAELRASDIMIPRAQMITINISDQPRDFLPTIISSAHSRFPVLGEDSDEVVGTLLAKDLLQLALDYSLHEHFVLKDILRPAFVIPESKRLDALLHDFRVSRNHMAVVINEYGGLAGLVTIEDVLEQIVGDIEDEHDTDEDDYTIREDSPGEFVLKAQTPIEDFNEFFGSHLDDEDFDTIGGLLLQHFGRLPEQGEQTQFDGFHFTVLAANERVIRLLKASRLAE